MLDSRKTGRTVTTYNTVTRKYDSVYQTYRYDLTAGSGSFYLGAGQTFSENDFRLYGRGGNIWIDSFRITDVARYEPSPIIIPNNSFAAPLLLNDVS